MENILQRKTVKGSEKLLAGQSGENKWKAKHSTAQRIKLTIKTNKMVGMVSADKTHE